MARIKEKAFWIAAGDIIGRGFSFAASVYLARKLGSEFYGLITVAISFLGYATWFTDLGLHHIGVRESARKPDKRIYRLVEVFTMKILLGLAVIALVSLILSFVEIEKTRKTVFFGYLFSVIPYMAMMEWYFSGKQHFGKIAISKSLNGFLYLTLVLIFIRVPEDVIVVPFLYTSGVLAASVFLGVFAVRRKAFSLPWRGFGIFPDLLMNSVILGAGSFFGQIVQLLPAILIGTVLSFHDAGQYGAALRIVLIAMLADRVFVNLLIPNLSAMWSTDRKQTAEHLKVVYRIIVTGGFLIALFTAVGAEQIIYLLYGSEYNESSLLLQILSLMIAFTFLNSLFSFGLIATGKDKDYFIATATGGILSAFFITIAVLSGSMVIVTFSVALSEFIITLSTYFRFSKLIRMNYVKPVIISLLCALGLFYISQFSPLMPLLNALIASGIFILLIMKVRVLEKSHLLWIKEKLAK